MNRLAGLLLVLLAMTGSVRAADPQEQVKEKAAQLQANSLAAACEAYALHPQSRRHPTKLAELAMPPFGKTSYLTNGKADLLDPWGKEFKYEVVEGDKGLKRPYVWTERNVDGKTKVYGQQPPNKKS